MTAIQAVLDPIEADQLEDLPRMGIYLSMDRYPSVELLRCSLTGQTTEQAN